MHRPALVLLSLLLASCGAPAPRATPGSDTDDFEYTWDDDDDDSPFVPPNDDEGSLILIVTAPELGKPNPTVTLSGMFADSRRGYENLAQCVTWQDNAFCAPGLPQTPDDYVEVDPFEEELLESLLPRDVGPRVELGGYVAGTQQFGPLYAYFAQLGTSVPEPGESLPLSFGPGAWGEVSIADAIRVPSPIEVTAPPIGQEFTFSSGTPVELRWTPGGEGDVYLAVLTPTAKRLYLLEDDGAYDLDLSGMGLLDETEVDLVLSRWTTEHVEIDGHDLALQVHQDQWFHGTYRDFGGRVQLVATDTCADAQAAAPITPGAYWGDIITFANNLSPGSSGCTSWPATGQDAILPYSMAPLEVLSVDLTFPGDDASLYLLRNCGNTASCLDGSDTTTTGGVESIVYFNNSEEPLDVYIVVDTYGTHDGAFTLDVESVVFVPDSLVDTCVEAMDQGPAAPGAYIGDIGFFNDLLDPGPTCGPSSPGGEGLVQVVLQSGETLTATANMPGSDTTLYLLYNCSISASCAASADANVSATETLVYTNNTAGSEILYLVVDAADATGQYVLDLDIN